MQSCSFSVSGKSCSSSVQMTTTREPINRREAGIAEFVYADKVIAAYLAPESRRAAIINKLIAFDGLQQREAPEASAGKGWFRRGRRGRYVVMAAGLMRTGGASVAAARGSRIRRV
jgi:hypothetical protein